MLTQMVTWKWVILCNILRLCDACSAPSHYLRTNVCLLLIWSFRTNTSDIFIKLKQFALANVICKMAPFCLARIVITHWGRVTHICVSESTIIGSDNGVSPGRRNNTGLLLIEPLGTDFSEISIGIQTFSFKKMHLNMSSAKWRPFCRGLNVLSNSLSSALTLLQQLQTTDCCDPSLCALGIGMSQ